MKQNHTHKDLDKNFFLQEITKKQSWIFVIPLRFSMILHERSPNTLGLYD